MEDIWAPIQPKKRTKKNVKNPEGLSDTMVTKELRKSLGHIFSGDDLSCTNVGCGKDFYYHQKNPCICNKIKRNINLDRALTV